ncbi:MAG: T9SS type A sorting domain-containing protein [Bacteroidia bacterium]|nr:T9SS type A sorting domain-containing protein [Bacteroidia bacterium]
MNHSTEVSVSWDKITGTDTTSLSTWNEYFVAVEAPAKSTIYRVSVITPLGAEIDEITVLVDTVLVPFFTPSIQFDSTVYFINNTQPYTTVTKYDWNFGDGSAHSTDLNPVHTFPAFNTTFKVCLTATNLCGSWMFCDTVWIDSAHWGGSMFAHRNSVDLQQHNGLNNKPQMTQQATYAELPVGLINYPNPFGNSTIIDYEIWQVYSTAELRITNMLGQSVFNQKLVKPIDKIQIDGSALHDGLYYYSIIIDGAVKQTKSMAVMH